MKSLGFVQLPPESIQIIFELTKNLAISALYDTIKLVILSIISKFRVGEKKTVRICIINNNKTSEIILPFEVTEEQKEQLVKAAIEKLLE